MESPLTRFSKTVEDYRRFRPGYPGELVDWITATAGVSPPARVLDLGCGTGIVSRLFAEYGFRVVGVDPNPDMLAVAQATGGGPTFVRARAEATGLTQGAFELAVAGQAFHWFDPGPTHAELARVVRAGGWYGAFWNERGHAGLAGAYHELLVRHCPEYVEQLRASRGLDAYRDAVAGAERREAEFANRQTMDREALLGRVRSSSYVAHGVADLAGFERELGGLFEEFQEGGRVAFDYRVIALMWRPDAGGNVIPT